MRILLLEDDQVLGSAIQNHTRDSGHGVDWLRRLDDAMIANETVEYDVIFLDLNLPDGNGIDFLNLLRERKMQTPIIIITAHDQVRLRIEALNAGADDYLVKPFDLDELTARAEAVVRRSAGQMGSQSSIRVIEDVSIDRGRKVIVKSGKSVLLTSREWAVLDCLLRGNGAIVSKSTIEDRLYSFGTEVESNAVEVFVSRIRKKLGVSLIKTVRGMGYMVATE